MWGVCVCGGAETEDGQVGGVVFVLCMTPAEGQDGQLCTGGWWAAPLGSSMSFLPVPGVRAAVPCGSRVDRATPHPLHPGQALPLMPIQQSEAKPALLSGGGMGVSAEQGQAPVHPRRQSFASALCGAAAPALCAAYGGGGLGASCPCPAPALGCSGCRGSGTEAGKASACSEAKMPFALQPRQEPENWIQEVWPSLSPGAACRPLSAPSPLSLHPCLELSCPLCLPLCSLPEEGLAVAPPGVRGSGRKCCVCSPSTEARTWDFGPGDGAPLAPERPGCQAAVKPVAGAAGPQEAASMCV